MDLFEELKALQEKINTEVKELDKETTEINTGEKQKFEAKKYNLSMGASFAYCEFFKKYVICLLLMLVVCAIYSFILPLLLKSFILILTYSAIEFLKGKKVNETGLEKGGQVAYNICVIWQNSTL